MPDISRQRADHGEEARIKSCEWEETHLIPAVRFVSKMSGESLRTEYSSFVSEINSKTEGKRKPEAPQVALCLPEAGEGLSRKDPWLLLGRT